MLGWQYPAAFWLLPVVAVPVIIHLLRVHRANRVLFPSLRFVQPSQSAAVRLQLPSDLVLLLLRMSIVGLAICAVASPVLVTQRRLAGWNAKVARAVVVDDSVSMQSTTAREAARAELANASYGRAFESKNIEQGIDRAVAWLATSAPARREIVVVSDFQRGAIDAHAPVKIPVSIGLRVVNVGREQERATVAGAELFGFDRVAARQQTMALTKDTTAVDVDSRESREPPSIEGLRILNATTDERDTLLRALAFAGAPAPSRQEPIAILFTTQETASVPLETSVLRGGWMLQTALRIRNDDGVISTASSVAPSGAAGLESPWTPLVSDRQGRPILLAATAKDELVLRIAASPDSLFSIAAVRAALRARHPIDQYSEHEIASLEPAILAAWARPPGPVDRSAWPTADANDSRWCWLAALILLGAEQWLRTRRVRTAQEVTRAAA